jgi:hypothetical protein
VLYAIKALSLPLQALLWPLHASHGLYKQSIVRSCQLFIKINIFTDHIVQKNFLKAMKVLLEAMRVLLKAVRVLLEAVKVPVEPMRVFWRSRVLLET